jgi:nitroimidazol reductase NimA-like FMN-containing flavoprotein (pyridoxamine 5'-phosphate oxidase superfamily)
MADLVKAREEESHELLAEVKALDAECRYQSVMARGLLRTCEKDEAELERLRESNDDLHAVNEMLRDTVSRSSREILRLRAELSGEIARRTLGGTPPGYHEPGAWANRAQPPPSASDESAPPLKRGLS